MLTAVVIFFISSIILGYCLLKKTTAIDKLKYEVKELTIINRKISEKQELLSRAEQISQLGTWEIIAGTNQISWSAELYKIYGFQDNNFVPNLEINQQVIAPEYREKVSKEINKAIENNTSFAVEYQVLLPSGLRKYVLGQGYYIEREAKLVGTIQDITELKEAVLKLKINESLLREAETVSHSGSWEWREGTEFILWSDEMYRIHGYLPHSVFINFQFYITLVHEDDREIFLSACKNAVDRKQSFKINYRIIEPNGKVKHILSTAEYRRISLNDQYAYIGNTQDVTELREAQVQLDEKMIELSRSNKDLEQFAYVASHDLQEPLRKIQAFGNLLKESLSGVIDSGAMDYLNRIHGASERMRKLVDDLLTFSKVGREQKAFTQVELKDVLNHSIHELDHLIELKSAVVKVDVQQLIDGMESQLTQLFINLLSNSLKFNKHEQPIIEVRTMLTYGHELEWSEALPSQQYCIVEVSDNGIGFEDSEAIKIFDVFQRLTSRVDYDGTGIGLALCKRIAENHAGFIVAKGVKGEGATFKVVLPIKKNKN
ncbi:sensor histidine kinase [Pedobacter sp. PWIIR3]